MRRTLSFTCLSLALSGAWATQAAATETRATTALVQQHEALSQALKSQRKDDALVEARKLLDLLLPDGNPYAQMQVSELLMVLLHQKGLYTESMQVVDRLLAVASSTDEGPGPGQMQALIERGVMAATMAQDAPAQARYQQLLLREARLYPGQWVLQASAQRLHFQTAQLTVPMALGRWALVHIDPAQDRQDSSQLRYIYAKPNGQRMFVDMHLNYQDAHSEMDAARLGQDLRDTLDIYSRDGENAAPQLAQPALTLADATQLQAVVREKSSQGPDTVHMHWVAARGNWRWHLHARLQHSDHALALQAIPALWQAMDWPQAPDLPQTADQPVLPVRESTIASTWRSRKDWPKAGQLARAALPDARFPSEGHA